MGRAAHAIAFVGRQVGTVALAGSLGVAGCGGGAPPKVAKPSALRTEAAPAKLVRRITPSRLVPEVQNEVGDDGHHEQGPRLLLVNGIRIAAHPDGRVERADQRFEGGAVRWLRLPPRLGRGFLFFQADSQGTRLWRADDWTGALDPLAQLGATADEVIPGFDRLLVRVEGSNRLLGVDATEGTIVPLGSLPAASAFGAMSFADGWRGVVDTDLGGPMATFDAGASWRPLPLTDRVQGAAVEEGDPVIFVSGGRYRVSIAGQVQYIGRRADEAATAAENLDLIETAALPALPQAPLGAQPLRTTVLSGVPETASRAIVARRGALMRVRLPEGTVADLARDAFAERAAECTGARVGAGYGFICGEPEGATAIYALGGALSLRKLIRFPTARFVAASGNGALVVRGGCAEQPAQPADGVRTYCILGVDGGRREIGVRGDLGAERVVALRDGRVVVLVPPRIGAPGRITTIDGAALRTERLSFPDGQAEAVRLAKRGLWLDGFQQRGAGSVDGWVEAGGPVLGVTVKMDGTVRLHEVVDESRDVLLSGAFGLAIDETGSARESVDGGRTWRRFDLPQLPVSPRDARTRGCSPVGCALRGWVRVGWGEPAQADDLEVAAVPEEVYARPQSSRAVRAHCTLAAPAPDRGGDGGGASDGGATRGDWRSFYGRPPPKLDAGELGVAKGTSSYDPVPAHVYVWGPKGADWSRAGWWVARFRDRFDAHRPVASSSPTRSLWGDQAAAA
ncbi:MAG: hypothetical protein JRI23_31500, partial [Deltaproteobacteria bacterium]|nr:hypothetical protein [Deltaproteobacteria bacterium]MBW2536742.1 hypothetical protein [Deltaproteobacteria bacterium]